MKRNGNGRLFTGLRLSLVVMLTSVIAVGVYLVSAERGRPLAEAEAAPPLQAGRAPAAPLRLPVATEQTEQAAQAERAKQAARAEQAPLRPTVFPDRLDAVPMTEWRKAQLSRYDEQEQEMLDYKLGLMSEMRRCLSGHRLSEGRVDVFLHYKVNPQHGFATGSNVELLDSSLSDKEQDQVVLECMASAHKDRMMRMHKPGPQQQDFHWATEFALPVENDRAYHFFIR
jgi:hypothetical protein